MAEDAGTIEFTIAANTVALRQAEKTMQKLIRTTIKVESSMKKSMGGVEKSTEKAGRASKKASGKMGKLNEVVNDLSSSAVLAVGPLSGVGARMTALTAITTRSSIAVAAMAAGVIGLGVGLVKLTSAAIRTAIEIESIKATLAAATGSAAKARQEFRFVAETAQRLGTDLAGTAKEYAKIAAASKGTRLEGQATRDIYIALSEATVAVQSSTDEASRSFKAVRQIISKTKVQAEELTGQLGESLPGALEAVANQMGVSTKKLLELSKAGKLSATEFIPALTIALKELAATGIDKAMQSTQAEINRLNNDWLLLKETVADSFELNKLFKSGLSALRGVLVGVEENLKAITQAIGLLSGALLGLSLPTIIKLLARTVIALRGVAVAMFAVNVASGGVITLLVKLALVLGTAVAGYRLFGDSVKESTIEMEAFTEGLGDTVKRLEDMNQLSKKGIQLETAETERQIRDVGILFAENLRTVKEFEAAEKVIAEYALRLRSTGGISREVARIYQGMIVAVNAQRVAYDLAKQGVKGFAITLKEKGAVLTNLKKILADFNRGLDDTDKKLGSAGKAVRNLVIEMRTLEEAQTKGIEPKNIQRFVSELLKARKIIADISDKDKVRVAAILGIDETTTEAFEAAIIKIITRLRETKDEIKKIAETQAQLLKEGKTAFEAVQTPLEQYQLGMEKLLTLFNTSNISLETYKRGVTALGEELKKSGGSIDEFIVGLQRELGLLHESETAQRVIANIEKARALAKKEGIALTDQEVIAIRNLSIAIEEQKKQTELARATQEQFAQAFSAGMAEAIVQGGDFVEIMQRVVQSLLQAIIQAQIFRAIIATTPVVGGGGSLFGAGELAPLARGGPASARTPYLVGEQGPELFVPSSNGNVVPNNQLGGMTVNIDARGADAGVEDRIRNVIQQEGQRNMQLTMQRIADNNRRPRRGF